MKNKNLEYFGNDSYLLLRTIDEHKQVFGSNEITKLSQDDISKIIRFSKTKVNTLMSGLKENKYVKPFENYRERYQITTKGKIVLDTFKKEF